VREQPSRDDLPGDGDPPEARPSVRPISAAALTAFGVAGLIGGWGLRRIGEFFDWQTPLVSWSQVLAPYVAAIALAILAWVTWTQLQRRAQRIDPHRAVNRLILARACALVGSLISGGYLGYAMSWLWVPGEYAGSMAVRAGLTGLGGLAMTISALALQRACRVRIKGDSDLV
jgi:Protein of unknown function (DUF3180)